MYFLEDNTIEYLYSLLMKGISEYATKSKARKQKNDKFDYIKS